MAVMPMFPLNSVLLPGEVLPLHVFEPRYRQLVIDLLAADDGEPEFGVTLIKRGHEVGGDDHRVPVGTVARVVRIDALDGGRYSVVSVGVRRIEVLEWLPDDPYPRAQVEDRPDVVPADDVDALTAVAAATHVRVMAARNAAIELGDLAERGDGRISDDPVLATYHLVSLAPVGPADRYRLLAAPTPMARLELLAEVLDDVEAVLRFRRAGP